MRAGLITAGLLMASGLVPLTTSAATAAGYTCDGHQATIVGSARSETLRGTDGPDVIVAGSGDDTIYGMGGDDIICGNSGADKVSDGAGNDRVFAGRDRLDTSRAGSELIGDTLVDGPGDDLLNAGADPRANDVHSYDAGPEWLDLGQGTGAETVDLTALTATGSLGNDRLLGNRNFGVLGTRYADKLTGSADDDHLFGRGGDDLVVGLGGNDVLSGDFRGAGGAGGNDRVQGGTGNDYATSFTGQDTLTGDAGADSINAFNRSGGVSLSGGSGDDWVNGVLAKADGNTFIGGSGRDELILDRPDSLRAGDSMSAEVPVVKLDVVPNLLSVGWATPSTAEVSGFESYTISDFVRFRFTGSEANEVVFGPWGHWSSMKLGGGDDIAYGGSRSDAFDGGPGRDTVYAGGGADRCTSVEVKHSC